MSNTKSRVALRKENSFIADVANAFETAKRTAKEEALKNARLQVATMREDLAKLLWESINVNGLTIADISAISGYSRATIYRFLDEHIENTGGNPGALLDAVKNAKMQKRFEYVGVEREEIVVLDTVTGKTSPLYIDNWKHEWYYHVLSARRGSEEWDAIPELDLLVSMVENGEFVPVGDVAKLARPIRERIAGAESIAASTPVKNEPSFDDWDM